MTSLAFESVGVTYAGTDMRVAALEDVSLTLGSGDAVAIIGPSGCGKSTLLLAAAGLLGSPAGRVAVDGSVLVEGRPVEGVRRTTALILQDFGLFPWKTVFHNAGLGLEIRGHGRAELRSRVMAALERVGLAEFRRAYPAELSGGMKQRLALARALALDADLLLMDEPLSALDALTREDLQDVLLELWRQRRHTSVLVTHSIEEAVYLGRRVVVLTPRPGTVAAIVENPSMGTPNYRDTAEFHAKAVELRRLLAEEGAVHAGASLAGVSPASVSSASVPPAGGDPR